ncbi:TlpA disulfide reductase family protein [Pedobacter aquatilis]|uniref:TlpA family protein disulfide reductase n=1 Tax=Pedobacter aquatilis TaxID=351343 RepID=UPI002930FB47|nr:TlpA disulfide reductase family protein [Pedobacter aquatilis]
MKKYFLIICLFLHLSAFSQSKSTTTKLDQNTIVKDESGSVIPYASWQKIIQTGEYSIRPIEKGSTEYLIYKMSTEEKLKSDERKKSKVAFLAKPQQSDAFKEGEKFKGERITDINANKFDLKKIGDKIYVLNFWFINCPPCKKEIPELNQLVSKYADNKDVVFIAIALDNSADLKAFLKTTPFNYNIVDDGKYYTSKYGVKGYPTHVLIGKDGLIKFSTLGLAENTVFWIEKTLKDQTAGNLR